MVLSSVFFSFCTRFLDNHIYFPNLFSLAPTCMPTCHWVSSSDWATCISNSSCPTGRHSSHLQICPFFKPVPSTQLPRAETTLSASPLPSHTLSVAKSSTSVSAARLFFPVSASTVPSSSRVPCSPAVRQEAQAQVAEPACLLLLLLVTELPIFSMAT